MRLVLKILCSDTSSEYHYQGNCAVKALLALAKSEMRTGCARRPLDVDICDETLGGNQVMIHPSIYALAGFL